MIVLETSKLFRSLSKAELQMLHPAIQTRSFEADKIVFTEGDEGDGLYVVGSGSVHISALVNKTERRVLTRLGPGDFFGEMAVVDNEPRSATATAKTEMEVYFIPRDDMLRMLETSPKLAVSLMREFSLRLREFNHQYIREVLEAERLALVGRFARSIVHDFKNPLNIIGLASELGSLDNATRETRQLAHSRIRKQVDRLSTMINELLEFSRGPEGTFILARTDYDRYVRGLVEEMRSEITEYRIALKYENEPPPIAVLLDPQRLSHVFRNLVNNAVDAMPEGGTIRFRFQVSEEELVTEIADEGPGIAPEMLPRLFEAFATHGKSQGTGLGLSICRRVIEDHHGRIEGLNGAQGGAVFRFALPVFKPSG